MIQTNTYHGYTLVNDDATDELEELDGKHHLWCKPCHPEWVARPLGAELGVPFVAVCGQRTVLLAVWQSDDLTMPGVCETCADPATPCATCGSL